ncbi:hypothetical protein [Dyella sp.]|uniref:hypothetical protein n=1 Tax=Dyella sp. TaxID=1869338 RepID=UPI002ED12A15
MPSLMVDLDQPRKKAAAAMRASLAEELWRRNEAFVDHLRKLVAEHPMSHHPAIAVLNEGQLNGHAMRAIHLEYRHAVVQIFTDALLAAQLQTRQLEPRLRPGSKLAPRFLLTLNDLDEFGFRPGLDAEGYYRGNPAYGHYPLFERVLDDYGVSMLERQTHAPSSAARSVREFLEHSYGNYLDVSVLLAVAEEEIILLSSAMRQATRAVGIDVSDGYYYARSASQDQTVEAGTDEHENDLWLILTQALTPDQYPRVQALCMRYCDLWANFWTHQLAMAHATSHSGASAWARAV